MYLCTLHHKLKLFYIYTHKDMSKLTYSLLKHISEYYAKEDITQLLHTTNVVFYTTLIATNEKYSEHQIQLLEAAALLHDIGCPNARKLYGKSLPIYQETEGKKLVPDFVKQITTFTSQDKEWLANVVGTHHQQNQAKALHFEPLYEADMIVNILEGYYPIINVTSYYKAMMTNSGKKLFVNIFNIKNNRNNSHLTQA